MKPTDEQIEKAAEAARIEFYSEVPTPWKHTDQDRWRRAVKAAAPFLQMPIAEPSEEELAAVWGSLGWEPNRMPSKFKNDVAFARAFVAHRNAPTPSSDPRREKIAELLDGSIMSLDQVDQLTDSILAIVDKEKP